jgi:hypothetical protein
MRHLPDARVKPVLFRFLPQHFVDTVRTDSQAVSSNCVCRQVELCKPF